MKKKRASKKKLEKIVNEMSEETILSAESVEAAVIGDESVSGEFATALMNLQMECETKLDKASAADGEIKDIEMAAGEVEIFDVADEVTDSDGEFDEELMASEGLDADAWSSFEDEELRRAGENPIAAEEQELLDSEMQANKVLAEEDVEFIAEGTELEGFESAEVEDAEFIGEDQMVSIVESLLFSTDRPMSLAQMKQAFVGTTIKAKQIRRALDMLAVEYAGSQRGVTIEEINGGYQMRTKIDNMSYLRRLVKARPFKLSGPALEVMAIAAYKQPVTKSEIDEIRGVESGHLMRGLMEKGLVNFAGKSDLPGKPMLYATTRKFLEIFGLRNIRELPSLNEIDQLIPEGIGEIEVEKEKLEDITGDLSRDAASTYSEGEEELLKISSELETITTSSTFFEDEKRREREKRDRERAQDVRDAITLGEAVEKKDAKWLERYDKALADAEAARLLEAQQGITHPTAEEAAAGAEEIQVEGENLADSIDQAFTEAFGLAAPDEEDSWEQIPVEAVDADGAPSEERLEQARIGDVSFDKLEQDMEIFNEEIEVRPEELPEA